MARYGHSQICQGAWLDPSKFSGLYHNGTSWKVCDAPEVYSFITLFNVIWLKPTETTDPATIAIQVQNDGPEFRGTGTITFHVGVQSSTTIDVDFNIPHGASMPTVYTHSSNVRGTIDDYAIDVTKEGYLHYLYIEL